MSWHLRPELLSEEFSRSSGPGGQNVNRRETRVELFYRFSDDETLSAAQKERIRRAYPSYLVGDHTLHVVCARERLREQNRRLGRVRLIAMIVRCLREPKKRLKTKPTRASREKRIVLKKKRSERKKLRKPPRD